MMHAVPYGELLGSSGMTWFNSSYWFQMSFQKLLIVWQICHLKQSLVFWYCLHSECHLLWQENQHVTSDFALGFSECLKKDSQNANTQKLMSCWTGLFALSSCLVFLFQHFCIPFFFLMLGIFTTVRKVQNVCGSSGNYSCKMSNTLCSESCPADPTTWVWWFFLSLF